MRRCSPARRSRSFDELARVGLPGSVRRGEQSLKIRNRGLDVFQHDLDLRQMVAVFNQQPQPQLSAPFDERADDSVVVLE